MDKTTYQKSVLATLDKKGLKAGLQQAAKHPQWSLLFQAIVGIAAETTALIAGTADYLSGAKQYNDDIKKFAKVEMGDLAFYLVTAAKLTKRPLPSSTKKAKVSNLTRTQAVLQLASTATALLTLAQQSFAAPVTKLVEKTVTIPLKDAATGAPAGADKVKKQMPVVNVDEQKKLFEDLIAKIGENVGELITDYWVAHAALFDEAPASTFAESRAQFASGLPADFFAKIDAPKPKKEKAEASEPKAPVAKKTPAKKTPAKQLAEPST